MYKMQVCDLLLMEDHIRYSHRPTWEAARILSVFQVAPHTKKKLKIEELFPLPWDKDQKATDGEMMKMMQHMQNLGAMMSQKMNQQIQNDASLERKDVPDRDKLEHDDNIREDSRP